MGLSGPAIAAALTFALRAALPSECALLSPCGVLEELAFSPVFYLPLAFAISWSLLGLRLARAHGRLDHWSRTPLLVWALCASRHLAFYFESGLYDVPPSARSDILTVAVWVLVLSLLTTLAAAPPTRLRQGRFKTRLPIDLLALLPLLWVLVDWALVLWLLTTAWALPVG